MIVILVKQTDNKIGDPGAKVMSKALKKNRTLTELGLSGDEQA